MLARVLLAYARARRMHFADRAALLRHQDQALQAFRSRVLAQSPYFSTFLDRPWHDWPIMDKAQMMRDFERMNTAGLRLEPLWRFAQDDEATRRFRATWHGYSVGL